MMKNALIFCFLVCTAYCLPADIYKTEWKKFKQTYDKKYLSETEENYRFKVFSENFDKIVEHNKNYASGLTTFKMEVNQYTDLTYEEMQEHMGLLVPEKSIKTTASDTNCESDWEKFKVSFGKAYSTTEEKMRLDIFCANLKVIEEHNKDSEKGVSTYRMGINKFTDMTEEELREYMGLREKNDDSESNQFLKFVSESCRNQYEEFKEQFNKAYNTPEDEMQHLGIFCENLNMVRKHNEDYEKGLTTFKMAVNAFSDMTPDEIRRHLGFRNHNNIGKVTHESMVFVEDICQTEYEAFKEAFGKIYFTQEDEMLHMKIFCKNIAKIEEHNQQYKSGQTTFEMGVNRFTDMTPEEIQHYMGFLPNKVMFVEDICKTEYESFKEAFGKAYLTQEDEAIHLNIFCKNAQKIKEHNEQYKNGQTTFEMGVNRFTDMTSEEIKRYLGVLPNTVLSLSKYLPEDVYQSEWLKFKNQFKKIYSSEEEEKHRFQIFCDNLDIIYKHNEQYEKGLSSFKLGVNELTDLTNEEYKELLDEGRL